MRSVEGFWSKFVEFFVAPYQDEFLAMEADGILDRSDEVHLAILELVYLPVLIAMCNQYREDYNSHRIRRQRRCRFAVPGHCLSFAFACLCSD